MHLPQQENLLGQKRSDEQIYIEREQDSWMTVTTRWEYYSQEWLVKFITIVTIKIHIYPTGQWWSKSS